MSERYISDTDAAEFESDESLRRVYGDHAIFQRVGAFTLVHLDTPTPDVLEKRQAEFSPDEYFFDDCPLCQHARDSGGHIIFDASDGDEEEDAEESNETDPSGRVNDDTRLQPSIEFDHAMQELSQCAITFDDAAKTRVPEWLADRIGFDVLILHDTIMSTIWDRESDRAVEPIETQIGRAFTTIAAARKEAPELEDVARPLEEALRRVVAAWRAL